MVHFAAIRYLPVVALFAMNAASLDSPATPSANAARRSRMVVAGIATYIVLAATALWTNRPLLAAFAVFVLVAAVLSPALRKHSAKAWCALVASAALIAWLAMRGTSWLLLDAVPIIVNVALCSLFARTLVAGRTPLIARFIAILESPERLRDARVANYARQLTLAWAFVLGAQAALLALIVLAMPHGLLAMFGVDSPRLVAPAWTWYLHVGSYLLVAAFLALEYAWRRWHLRHIAHPPLPKFALALVQRWPALVQSLGDDAPRSAR